MQIFTCDQYLYKAIIDILFYNPTNFKYLAPIVEGIHVNEHVNVIAILLAGSGLLEVLAGKFIRLDKTPSRKKYPQKLLSTVYVG